jgi:thiosulfate/3-mercaptopyruvate sulfurtransferase
MSELGVADGDTVVAYDDAGGVIAARLVWMLRVTGHRAALLDGGLGAGARRCPGGLEFQTRVRPRAAFTARPWPADRLAGIDDAADRGNVVLDARNRDRYRGEGDPVDPRSGHIPGARNLPCRQNLAADATFLPAERLRRGFAAVGVRPGSTVVSYCGSGVTACHNLLALEIAGLGPGRLYPGSWSHYSRVPDRPMETGDPAGTPPP